MKKIILLFIMLFWLIWNTFADTQVHDFWTNDTLFINWDNVNWVENWNARFIYHSVYYGTSYWAYKIHVRSITWADLGIVDLLQTAWSFTMPTWSNSTIIDWLWYTYILRNTIANWVSVGTYWLHYNKTSWVFTKLRFTLHQNDNKYIAFTFDDNFIYFRFWAQWGYYYHKYDLWTATLVDYTQPAHGYTFSNTYNLYFNVSQDYKFYIKSKLTDEYYQYYYDLWTQSVLQATEPLEGTWSSINKFQVLDQNEYIQSEGFSSYLKTFWETWYTKSFTGYLSYVNATATWWLDHSLNFIPAPSVIWVTDYDRSYSPTDWTYWNYPFAGWSWSWSLKRLYYLKDNILYFNNDQWFIDDYTDVIATVTVDEGNDLWLTIFGFDLDADGNGEIDLIDMIRAPLQIISNIFTEAWSMITKLKEIIIKFTNIWEFSFNLFEKWYAYDSTIATWVVWNFNIDMESDDWLTKILNVLKNFVYFVLFLILVLLIIIAKRK